MKSSAVAPKRKAIAASWMTSPAFTPSMETPTTRRVGASSTIFITPRVSRVAPARGTALMGMVLHSHAIPAATASSSVRPTTATSGSVKMVRGMTVWSTWRGGSPERALWAAILPSCAYGGGHLALGLPPDHITGGPDMGGVGAQGAVHAHGPRLVYLHA